MIVNSSFMDRVFKSLADSTRRDILRRLVNQELSVSEIAEPYDLTYAAISKHLKVLQEANLIEKRRVGKRFMVQTNFTPLLQVDQWMDFYRKYWQDAFDSMDDYLTQLQQEPTKDEP